MLTQLDKIFMRQAIQHAYDGHGLMRSKDQIARPSVGCIVVSKKGNVVGFGHTSEGGKPHAEPNALEMAGDKAFKGTAYVTLEPCVHDSVGKIACVKHIVAAGIARVVIGVTDIHGSVNGKGIQHLSEHNIEVVVCTGQIAKAAFEANRPFFLNIAAERPYIGIISSSETITLNDKARLAHQSVLSSSKESIKKAAIKSSYEATNEDFLLTHDLLISMQNVARSGITKLLITDDQMISRVLNEGLWDEAHTFSVLEKQPNVTAVYSKYLNVAQAGKKPFPKKFHSLIP